MSLNGVLIHSPLQIRENQQKPNKDLINNFQATYSDVVRPGADPDSSAR